MGIQANDSYADRHRRVFGNHTGCGTAKDSQQDDQAEERGCRHGTFPRMSDNLHEGWPFQSPRIMIVDKRGDVNVGLRQRN